MMVRRNSLVLVLAVCMMSMLQQASAASCPSSDWKLMDWNCYYILEVDPYEKDAIETAQRKCENRHAALISFDSKAEMSFLIEYLQDNYGKSEPSFPYWMTSGRRQDNKWTWAFTGKAVADYTLEYVTSSTENCLAFELSEGKVRIAAIPCDTPFSQAICKTRAK